MMIVLRACLSDRDLSQLAVYRHQDVDQRWIVASEIPGVLLSRIISMSFLTASRTSSNTLAPCLHATWLPSGAQRAGLSASSSSLTASLSLSLSLWFVVVTMALLISVRMASVDARNELIVYDPFTSVMSKLLRVSPLTTGIMSVLPGSGPTDAGELTHSRLPTYGPVTTQLEGAFVNPS